MASNQKIYDRRNRYVHLFINGRRKDKHEKNHWIYQLAYETTLRGERNDVGKNVQKIRIF